MINNDKTLIQARHLVLEETCRLAWNNQLDEEHKEKTVYKIIPGPRPAVGGCCIYKEREIVHHRTRPTCDESLMESLSSRNRARVIKPVCDECSLSSCTVMNNCRLCLGKAYLSSCYFGAVTVGEFHSHISSRKCEERGMYAQNCPCDATMHPVRPCKKTCPVDTITYDEHGPYVIDKQKYIKYGHCICSCPFGAISTKSYLVNVIQEIRTGKEIIAICAPMTEGQSGEKIGMDSVRNALKKVGSTDMVEVGLGDGMTAAYKVLEWSETRKEDKKMMTSYCLTSINLLRRRFSQQYEESMLTTVSPMCAASRYLRAIHPSRVTVFIGPRVAKKSESVDRPIPNSTNYIMTYGEFSTLLRSADVQLEPEGTERQEASVLDERFATLDDVTNAVLECMSEHGEDVSEIKLLRCAGGTECKEALWFLKLGRVAEDLIEGMTCPSNCIGGPSKHRTEIEIRRSREAFLERANDREVLDSLKNYPMEEFSIRRDGHRDLKGLERVESEA